MPRKGKKLKKLTSVMLVIHRYLGFGLSLLFLFWFLSGFVMMYKDFPYLSEAEVWVRSENIPFEKFELSAQELILANGLQDSEWGAIKIITIKNRPVYKLTDGLKGKPKSKDNKKGIDKRLSGT